MVDMSEKAGATAAKPLQAEELQSKFRKQGWNLAGANVLAAACCVAQNVFLYVRPRLKPADSIYVVVLTAAGTVIPGKRIPLYT